MGPQTPTVPSERDTNTDIDVDDANIDLNNSEAIFNEPAFIVVMGVSGTGKSTLGTSLAAALGLPYIDGDDLHPQSNVDKMARGEPLSDADRAPWLRRIRGTAEEITGTGTGAGAAGLNAPELKPMTQDGKNKNTGGKNGVVVACSALRKVYRDVLRGKPAIATGTETQTEPATNGNDAGHHTDTDANVWPNALRTYFIFIDGARDVLLQRMEHRSGHFMKANMLDSQLALLEHPEGEEDVFVVSVNDTTAEQVEQVVAWLKTL
uniref:gluconokinase n=1 Tax=Mycena chlorophos TaxID=658473 RepID=A0ABQ0L6N8_MYCCL|nr:predicted protein [Mycena chlorophos]